MPDPDAQDHSASPAPTGRENTPPPAEAAPSQPVQPPSKGAGRAPESRAPWLALAAGALAAAALYPFDGPLYRAIRGLHQHLGGDIKRTLETLQQFGDLATTLLIVWAICLLDRRQRARLLDWLAAVIAGGIVANLLKMLIGRPRPKFADPETIPGPFGAYPLGVDHPPDGPPVPKGVHHAWEVWADISSDLWSLPSSHTMHACIAAAALAVLYPRLRPMVILLACIVGLSRVLLGAHWPSDVAAGAGVGTCLGLLAMRGAWGRRLVLPAVEKWRGQGRSTPPTDEARG